MDLRHFRLRPGTVEIDDFPDDFDAAFTAEYPRWTNEERAHLNYARGHWYVARGEDDAAIAYFSRAKKWAKQIDDRALVSASARMIAIMRFEAFLSEQEATGIQLQAKHAIESSVMGNLDLAISMAVNTTGDVHSMAFALLATIAVYTSRLFLMLSKDPLADDFQAVTNYLGQLVAELFLVLDGDVGREFRADERCMAVAQPVLDAVDRALKLDGESVVAIIERRIGQMGEQK